MASTVNVGVRIPVRKPYDTGAVREFVQEAERLRYHSVWVGDHVYFRMDIPQPFAILNWVAALTSRVRLGTAVMLTAYLNPVFFARDAATLDFLSNGRLTLGISLGGTEAEYKSIGVPMKQRVSRLVENVEIARRLWTEDGVSYQGRYHTVENGQINPKPVQKPGVPLWFGGASEPSLRRTAEIADGWIGSAAGPTDRFVAAAQQVLGYVREQGRDVASFGVGKLQSVSVDADPARARSLAEAQWQTYYSPTWDPDQNCLHGDPEAVRAKVAALASATDGEITLALEPSDLTGGQLALLKEAVSGVPGASM